MIGLLDSAGSGLVRAAIGADGPALEPLESTRSACTRLVEGSVDALILECERVEAELESLLSLASSSEVPALVVARERSVSAAVEALRHGASDYLVAPFELESLHGAIARLRDRSSAARGATHAAPAFVTVDPELRRTLELARSIAASDATVLIEGESGTGKELLARMVHAASPRGAREVISVNCAALPPGLLESELFGHERGAFTGAFSRVIGKFELAHQTTLLLDEIGELELGLQAKLLRVLQEREVQRIGAPRPTRVDFRLIATTNRRLAEEVRRQGFREDLFYRLNVVPIRLPPLRERPHDVRVLVDHFSAKLARGRATPRFGPASLDALAAHTWPGNARELENVLERLLLTHSGREVPPSELGLGVEPLLHDPRPAPETEDAPRSVPQADPPYRTIREMERWLIVDRLRRLDGNRTRAARSLGISLRTLRNKINEYNVVEPDTLPKTGTAAAAHRRRQISPGSP